MREVEVSAIMEAGNGRIPMAITPDSESLYLYRFGRWHKGLSGFNDVNHRWMYYATQGPKTRKIHRGIYKIKVPGPS